MSSLNIELVHIILTAVSEKTVGTPKHANDFRVYQDYDFNNKHSFTLDCIEIQNRKDWDINDVIIRESLFIRSKGLKEALIPGFQTLLGLEKS